MDESKSKESPVRRISNVVEGHGPGSNGIHGDEWCYVVTDGQIALVLIVFTSRIKNVERPDLWSFAKPGEYPQASNLTYHTTFPRDLEQLRKGKPRPCAWVDGPGCYDLGGTALGARDFFAAHGVDAFEQSEAFWVALEARFESARPEILAERVDVPYERCGHCDGAGVLQTVQKDAQKAAS